MNNIQNDYILRGARKCFFFSFFIIEQQLNKRIITKEYLLDLLLQVDANGKTVVQVMKLLPLDNKAGSLGLLVNSILKAWLANYPNLSGLSKFTETIMPKNADLAAATQAINNPSKSNVQIITWGKLKQPLRDEFFTFVASMDASSHGDFWSKVYQLTKVAVDTCSLPKDENSISGSGNSFSNRAALLASAYDFIFFLVIFLRI